MCVCVCVCVCARARARARAGRGYFECFDLFVVVVVLCFVFQSACGEGCFECFDLFVVVVVVLCFDCVPVWGNSTWKNSLLLLPISRKNTHKKRS